MRNFAAMSVSKLLTYLPEGAMPFLRQWFGDYAIHIRITRNRDSKLGDYRKLSDGSHEISINSTLQPELFFFVLTHELAHLLAFEKFGRQILPHGNEWKHTYREMLIQSLDVYSEELKPVIFKFSKSPKANFMASPDLVRYFRPENSHPANVLVETLSIGESFSYKGHAYKILARRKMNYLCRKISTGRDYVFKPLAEVTKINTHEQ